MSEEKLNEKAKAISVEKEEEYTEQEVQRLFDKAREQTVDTIADFIRDTMDGRNQTYSSVVTSITACAIAAAAAADKMPQGGITGFQAGYVMWQFIREWNHTDNKTGMRLVDYDNMLYPQYADQFDKVISPRIMENLQTEIKKRMEENKKNGYSLHQSIQSHWESILDGKAPFGYTVKETF